MAVAAMLAFSGHIPCLYLFVNHLKFGAPGAAIANTITSFNFALALSIYVRYFPGPHRKAWAGWYPSALDPRGWGPLLKLALPSCISTCQEWWAYEAMIIMSGYLARPHVTVASMSVVMNCSSLFYMLPLALSFAAAARVGKELGAGRPHGARTAAKVAAGFGITAGLLMFATIETLHGKLSRFFTKDEEVIALVSKLLVILGICELGNAPQALMGAILKGAGRPSIGAWLGIVTYYVLALPLAVTLAFYFHWETPGLWWALVFAQSFQFLVLGVFVLLQNWEDLADRAKKLAEIQGEQAATAVIALAATAAGANGEQKYSIADDLDDDML
jgi:MATE family multidrug resistance protein